MYNYGSYTKHLNIGGGGGGGGAVPPLELPRVSLITLQMHVCLELPMVKDLCWFRDCTRYRVSLIVWSYP